MNEVLPAPDRQVCASEEVSPVYHRFDTNKAKEPSSLLAKLANSAYASWLSNGRQSFGV